MTTKTARLLTAVTKFSEANPDDKKYQYTLKAPDLPRQVAQAGIIPPVRVAMDSGVTSDYSLPFQLFSSFAAVHGFPGYPYLANLATRAEYQAFASALSTEITREWIKLTTADSAGPETAVKVKELEDEIRQLGLRDVIATCVMHDCYFGRAQIYVDIRGADADTPLVLSDKTIAQGSLLRVKAVEPMWTTPCMYNAIDPAAPDFYKPTSWYMLSRQVHATRLLTIITRPLPDMLKPAFNFGGMSLSQLAEPYVDNWLRTRQSVADLVSNFSTSVLATDMSQALQGGDCEDGASDLFARAQLFTQTRTNRGLMMLDKEREELIQVNTPLSGLDQLQAQAQEHMCSVSRIPAVKLTGISPSGLNASSDGEMRAWYDWVAAQQETFYRKPIETVLKVLQLSLWGEIDPHIDFKFVSLYQINPVEESQKALNEANATSIYVNGGIISPEEARAKLVKDPESGYEGLDPSAVPELPDLETAPEGETDPTEDPGVGETGPAKEGGGGEEA